MHRWFAGLQAAGITTPIPLRRRLDSGDALRDREPAKRTLGDSAVRTLGFARGAATAAGVGGVVSSASLEEELRSAAGHLDCGGWRRRPTNERGCAGSSPSLSVPAVRCNPVPTRSWSAASDICASCAATRPRRNSTCRCLEWGNEMREQASEGGRTAYQLIPHKRTCACRFSRCAVSFSCCSATMPWKDAAAEGEGTSWRGVVEDGRTRRPLGHACLPGR